MKVVKIVEYGLAPEANEAAFIDTSRLVTPEMAKMTGFIKRELHKGEDGRWRDTVYWRTRKDADDSEAKISSVPECINCISMMDASSMSVKLFELIS